MIAHLDVVHSLMQDRGHLATEQRNDRSTRFDRLTIAESFDLMSAEDAGIAAAVACAREDISRAIELVVKALSTGGKLVYVGAGTSGRLGVLDAAECPPTFLSNPEMIQGVIAGGREAMFRSIEGAEDDPEAGARCMVDRSIGPNDVVFGIATGGTTPFVHGAIRKARELGAKTVFFACVSKEQVPDDADVSIRVFTGPEVLTGSTRLKAGTATKMVLNMVSTITMVQQGKVYRNLMVDVNTAANRKLVDRGIRIIQEITSLPREECRRVLDAAGGSVKVALVMHRRQIGRSEAERLISKAVGRIGLLLDD